MYHHELPSYLIQDGKIPGKYDISTDEAAGTSEGSRRYSKEILNKLNRKAEKPLSEDKFQSSSKSRLTKELQGGYTILIHALVLKPMKWYFLLDYGLSKS